MSEMYSLLCARPSLIEGVARILDFGNTLTEFNQSLTPQQTDYLALRSDWRVVAGDLWSALAAVEHELGGAVPDVEEEPAPR